jgi:hypothetical protein
MQYRGFGKKKNEICKKKKEMCLGGKYKLKKVIICNIPMRKKVADIVYKSLDQSIPVSDKPFRYPINSFLSKTLKSDDELKIILLVKKDGNEFYERNIEEYKKEIECISSEVGINTVCEVIDTDFSQKKEIHEQLMGKIVDEIDEKSHISIDITYGPKDLPIVLFSALNFAEKFLKCEIDNIFYGQAEFDKENDEVMSSVICDMTPLYYLSSVTNTIKCDDPDKARQMLKSLLSL